MIHVLDDSVEDDHGLGRADARERGEAAAARRLVAELGRERHGPLQIEPDVVLVGVAHGAVELQRRLAHAQRGGGGPRLDRRRHGRIALAAVEGGGDLEHERAHQLDLHELVHRAVLEGLETADRHAELPPGLEVLERRVVGVLDVANDIEVNPSEGFARSDTELARAVRSALEWDALVPDEQIQSTVSDGWVTLDGEVNYWRERIDAERAIRRLTGVVGVINNVMIHKQAVNEQELREEIEGALEIRADRETERLRIEVHDGAVDLWGRVHSWQERRAVLGSISHAPGVTQVRDHLRIDPYF